MSNLISVSETLSAKLKKSNEIIAAIADSEKCITPVVPEDYRLFEAFFAKEDRHTYGNSWIYVTQSTYGIGPHNLGYKYYDGENLCMLSIFPKIENPNIIVMYWIRPLGENILTIITEYAERIKQRYGICCYVKKIFPDQYEFLLKHGFKSVREFPWHSSAHSEDDTYPELIYEREKTLKAIENSTKRNRLGSVVRGVSKLKCENKIDITANNFKEYAWKITNDYFLEYSNLTNKPNLSNPFDYYNMIFHHSDSTQNTEVDKKIIFVNDEPVGFYVLMKDLKINTTSIYSYITLRQYYKYLTDLLNLSIFTSEKTKYINGGGSEDKGIWEFKEKYAPIKENMMYWATNYF